jgi:hypothetical protein
MGRLVLRGLQERWRWSNVFSGSRFQAGFDIFKTMDRAIVPFGGL